MSLTEFKKFFLDNILRFLWRQWSSLGVLGEARADDPWIIDPEALLIFTLPIARYEPRLFDEVLTWIIVNKGWLDNQRMRTIIKSKSDATHCLLGAALLAPQDPNRLDRKWTGIIKHCEKHIRNNQKVESLFKTLDGRDLAPAGTAANKVFKEFGFARGGLNVREIPIKVTPSARMTLRFLLRGLFGIGSRSECILYLLTHDGGHPSEISKAIGTSQLAAQQMLYELNSSGLILTRSKGGRRLEYWLSQNRWWGLLAGPLTDDFRPPVYIDWISLFSALTGVWETLTTIDKTKSDYIKSSKLRDAFEKVGNEFARSGLSIPKIPGKEVSSEDYEKTAQQFISNIFGG